MLRLEKIQGLMHKVTENCFKILITIAGIRNSVWIVWEKRHFEELIQTVLKEYIFISCAILGNDDKFLQTNNKDY